MRRSAIVYGLILAIGAFVLQWLEIRYATRLFSTEIYIVLIASLFTGIGIWIGARITGPATSSPFEQNEQVIKTLGLTSKQIKVLERLAEGDSNQEIATRLFIAPSTVKTHLLHVYQKLEVSRRTQAVQKARTLNIIP